jgi:uncharacterized damage-inducible protein DinB
MPAPIEKSALLTHYDYTLWASSYLLDAAARLTEEELSRDLKVSHSSFLKTLQHVYYADRIWLCRITGREQQFMDPEPGPSIDDLKAAWPEVIAGFRGFIDGASPEMLASDLRFKRLNGDEHAIAHCKVLLHVVNHATLHRGQLMGMLRQLGHAPPATDILFFYLQQGR